MNIRFTLDWILDLVLITALMLALHCENFCMIAGVTVLCGFRIAQYIGSFVKTKSSRDESVSRNIHNMDRP